MRDNPGQTGQAVRRARRGEEGEIRLQHRDQSCILVNTSQHIIEHLAEKTDRIGPLRPGNYIVRAGVGEGCPLSKIADAESVDAGQVAEGEEIEIGDLFVPPDFRAGK